MDTNTLEVIHHADRGHGWLQVTRAMVDRLGIADKISKYSYQSGAAVYLEEDCDAGLLARAVEATGTTLDVKQQHSDYDSPIRAMARFTA